MADLPGDALATFDALFDEALAAGEPDPTAMVVATASLDARPSARTTTDPAGGAAPHPFKSSCRLTRSRRGGTLLAYPQSEFLP